MDFDTEAAMSNYYETRTYLPTSMDPDDINAAAWNIQVRWMRPGEPDTWSVLGSGFREHRLSRTGKWLWCPSRMNLRWCYFDFETACQLAAQHIETLRINGSTWAEAQERRLA